MTASCAAAGTSGSRSTGASRRDNIARVAAAGADTFVAGSAIFGAGDYRATIAAMRAEIHKARSADSAAIDYQGP